MAATGNPADAARQNQHNQMAWHLRPSFQRSFRRATGDITQTAGENSYLVLRYGLPGSGGVLFGNMRSWLACSKA
jgi:hypothetical protein